MKRREIFFSIIIVTVIGVLVAVWLTPAGSRPAPTLTMTTTEGDSIALSQLRNRPVLVNFWATTCVTCLKEMPHLIELYERYHARGLEIIGVSMYYDPPIQVVEMIKQRNIPYPIVMDIDKRIVRAFEMPQMLTPSTYLIAPDGRIVLHKFGLLDMQDLEQRIVSMLPPHKSVLNTKTE